MTQYLLPQDLDTVSRADIRGVLTGFDDNIIFEIIDESMQLMSSYLSNQYDMAVEYAKTGTARNSLVLKYLKDIVIYEVYSRVSHEVNEVAQIRYDSALKWLKEVSSGKLLLQLDLVDGTDADGDGKLDGEFFLNTGKARYQTDF